VRVATGGVVPLQQQDSLAGVPREQYRHCKSADAGADDDRVPPVFQRLLLVRKHSSEYKEAQKSGDFTSPAGSRRTVKWNVLPSPGVLSTQIRPSII
jgi:hypothetical protein